MTWRNFTDKYSWKCMLGPRAVDLVDNDNIYSWRIGNKNHVMFGRELVEDDIEYLKGFLPFGFYYSEEKNVLFLKKYFKCQTSKSEAIEIHIDQLDLVGKRYSNIRNAINKCDKYGIEFVQEMKEKGDISKFIKEWSETIGFKKFRNFSNKNIHFFNNNFNDGCINLFGYKEDKLVSFGVISKVEDYGSYIIGKALYKDLTGLSEKTDIEIYKLAREKGIKTINLSGGSDGVKFYKQKFPCDTVLEYSGKVINVKV